MIKDFHIWEGIYKNFDEVPSCNDGFESQRWIESNYKKTKSALDCMNEKNFVNINSTYNASSLPIIISLLISQKEIVNILDFGGRMGISYIQTCAGLPDNTSMNFTVVEGKKNCEKAEALFKNDSNIKFTDSLPEDKIYDIVHISSSLQYIKDWKGLLKLLCEKYDAKYIIFNDLPAGDIVHTFATYQNYYESKIPYWFFKITDVVEEIEKFDFELIFKSNFTASILGKHEIIPQDNFPEEYQVLYSKNLIFKRCK